LYGRLGIAVNRLMDIFFSIPDQAFDFMDTVDWVRSFFKEQLTGMEVEHLRRRPDMGGSMRQLIAHLVDQTVRRAVLDAAAHRSSSAVASPDGDISWKNCLMVAALIELRSIKLLARNRA
jgi:hypothetical protein